MTAFAIILRHEMLRLARGRWLLPLWLAFLAVGAYAAWTGAAWTEQRRVALDAIAAEERTTHQLRRTQIAEQVTPVNKSRYGGALYATAMSMRAVLPPGELAVLTVGQAEGYPMAATIFPFTASNTIFDAHLAGLENPAVLAAGIWHSCWCGCCRCWCWQPVSTCGRTNANGAWRPGCCPSQRRS
jgi:ABC-2 type transport system permease protein